MQLKAVLFDLDGTLVDTAPDMVATLNRVLQQHNYPTIEFEQAKNLVSSGAAALLEFGFEQTYFEQNREQLISEFLTSYEQNVYVHSELYQGIAEVLELCQSNQLHWGVVTNKPFHLSKKLLNGLALLEQCAILVGGDSMPVKKPHPAPLLHCTMSLHLAASECIYVGDHERDIIAGNAAGMDTAIAKWGYIDSSENIEEWQAKYLIERPIGLVSLIKERLGK